MILLDYVGNRGLRLPREGTSTAALWGQLRTSAARAGKSAFFPAGTGTAIIDDHTPFLQRGIPAIDLIDWSYPGHTLQDGMDKIDPKALDAVGETVLDLVQRLRAR
jgi:hypothetical protein